MAGKKTATAARPARPAYSGAASATGHSGRVMGAAGCALFLVCSDPNDGKILHAWAGISGSDGIKPDVWYTLDSTGKPVEAAQ